MRSAIIKKIIKIEMKMLKDEYLNKEEVKEFISWLTKTIKNEKDFPFKHSYEIETKGKSNKTKHWECSSFYDAYTKYAWDYSFTDLFEEKKNNGSSFEESAKVLQYFETKLIKSIKNNDNEACYKVCCMILDWGGVLGSNKKGNKNRLNKLKPNLCLYLNEVRKIFNSSKVPLSSQYKVKVNDCTLPITMNAGFTKIYSLLCDNFIIYDGRVGASLGLLVRYFYEQRASETTIPDSLSFYYGVARNSKVNRNPSKDTFIFKALSSSMAVHIRNNLKANWIIQSITSTNSCGNFYTQSKPVRGIESALFMIGYKIKKHI